MRATARSRKQRNAPATPRPASPRLFPVLLLVAAALAYSNSLTGPFIYDDKTAIVGNPHIRSLWPLEQVLTAPYQSPIAGRPLAGLSLALNYAAGGLDVRGYHATNLALHALCALVLFGCIRRTLRVPLLEPRYGRAADELAFASALLWVLHPLNTECVNYVTQRTGSLMALLYLLTLYASIRARATERWGGWHTAAVVSCALGVTAKESMVTAPFMVVLYDVCFHGGGLRRALRERRQLYAGLLASWLLLAALNWWGPRSASIGGLAASFEYALNQCVILVHYLRLIVWPDPLVLDYGMPQSLSIAEVLPQAAVLLALLAATGFALWRRPPLGFLGAWFFVILSPTSSIVPILTEVGAERRLYLPLAAAVVLFVLAAWTLVERRGAGSKPPSDRAATGRERAFQAGVLAVAIVLGWLTFERNREYQTEIAIWQSSVAAWPDNARSQNNLGLALQDRNRDAAMARYHRALEIDPGFAHAYHNIGNTLRLLGRPAEAIPFAERAVELEPDNLDSRISLGSVLGAQGRLDEAMQQFERALAIHPHSADAHANLGYVLALKNDRDAALREYELALSIAPTAITHYNLGNLLLELDRRSEALDHFREAARLDPGWADAQERVRRLAPR